jgi:hypothetical protein
MRPPVRNGYLWALTLVPAITLISQFTASSNLWLTDDPFLVASMWLVGSAATVTLAYFDWQLLTRAGVAHPFSWAWAVCTIANLSLVYIAGRVIVAKKNGVGGSGAAWVGAGLLVAELLAAAALAVLALWAVLTQMSDF